MYTTVPGGGKTREDAVRDALNGYAQHEESKKAEQIGQSADIIDFKPKE